MSDEREYTIIKIIITSITLVIATLMIILFIAVTKVDAAMVRQPIINMDIYNNNSFSGTPMTCSKNYTTGSINNCTGYIFSFTARVQANGVPLVVQNETYKIQIELIAQPMPFPPSNTSMINSQIYFLVNNNWIQATPDRFENKTLRNNINESTLSSYTWSFELDSTVYTDISQVNISFSYGSLGYISEFNYWIENLSIQSDTERIINSVDEQTNQLKENQNENGNKIIEKIQQQTGVLNNLFNSQGTIEDSKKTTTNNMMTNTEQTEEGYINNFKGNSVNYNIQYNQNAYTLIWNIIERVRGIHESITILITSCLVILLVSQIFRRSKL